MFDDPKSLHGDTPEDELSAAQLYERLQGAKLVTANLQRQIDGMKIVHGAVSDECIRRGETIKGERAFMARLALRLARAGSYDHKGKNEVILDVVADLLATSAREVVNAAARDMDDIPF